MEKEEWSNEEIEHYHKTGEVPLKEIEHLEYKYAIDEAIENKE